MRTKIQRSMIAITFGTLLISYILLTWIMYEQSVELRKEEVNQEARYILAAVNISGSDYLKEMDEVDLRTRVTQISPEGEVLYDSGKDAETLENHGNRPEVASALTNGFGEDIRRSGTIGEKMYYYALILDDGTVLRVAKTMDNIGELARSVLSLIIGLGVVMLVCAWILGKWQTARLIKPINELDIEHPLEHVVYEELRPLLVAMDKRNREREKVEIMRKEFSANVSHELKTPLTSISGYAEIMKNGLVKEQDIPKFSERIYKEARRLITLIEDIIKLSKLDEGSVELEKENVNLYNLCRASISRLSVQANNKHVHITMSGESIYYYGIRQILDEMIYNICENAIKYNVDGGEVSVWTGNTLKGPKIIVEDNGIGIPKEHHERIFERFYRVDKSHSKDRGGTGLGLSIVKHGALLHNIQVKVDSEEGRGTKMEILFWNEE